MSNNVLTIKRHYLEVKMYTGSNYLVFQGNMGCNFNVFGKAPLSRQKKSTKIWLGIVYLNT